MAKPEFFPMLPVSELKDPIISQPVSAYTSTGHPSGDCPSAPPARTDYPINPGRPIPYGLAKLNSLDQLIIKQRLESAEMSTGYNLNYETKNTYVISDKGEKVYYAAEESDTCLRGCLGSAAPFKMIISDSPGNADIGFLRIPALSITRPFSCGVCCLPCCCFQEMQVTSRFGQVLGSVQQNWSFFYPKFSVKGPTGKTVLHIRGPLSTFSCCGGDVVFDVLSRNGQTKVGQIVKQWSGIVQEWHTDADNFEVNFPVDLDVNIKALLLAATFVIDFMFFETNSGSRRCLGFNRRFDGIF